MCALLQFKSNLWGFCQLWSEQCLFFSNRTQFVLSKTQKNYCSVHDYKHTVPKKCVNMFWQLDANTRHCVHLCVYFDAFPAIYEVFSTIHVSDQLSLSGLFFLSSRLSGDSFIKVDGSVCFRAAGTLCLVDLNGYSQPLLTYSRLPGN